MAVSERIETWRRERRVLTRVARAAWRLRSAERERDWALASARDAGISIRKLAAEAGLSPSRVHQLLAARDPGALDVAVGQLREVGWPAPEDPDTGDDDPPHCQAVMRHPGAPGPSDVGRDRSKFREQQGSRSSGC